MPATIYVVKLNPESAIHEKPVLFFDWNAAVKFVESAIAEIVDNMNNEIDEDEDQHEVPEVTLEPIDGNEDVMEFEDPDFDFHAIVYRVQTQD